MVWLDALFKSQKRCAGWSLETRQNRCVRICMCVKTYTMFNGSEQVQSVAHLVGASTTHTHSDIIFNLNKLSQHIPDIRRPNRNPTQRHVGVP